jgi:hypothetical protein
VSLHNRLPAHAVRLTTYDQLLQYVSAFADGHLNLVMIFGPPGVGKSRCLRRLLAGRACWISGQASPFGIYLTAYEHQDEPLVLDDVDGLYSDRSGVRLLKALGQSEPSKTLSWHSAAPLLVQRGVPRQFATRSRVVLVGNCWHTLNADVAALEDRGHLLLFEPSPAEVHRQAAEWFWDAEIFDLIAEHLHLMTQHSLRTYQQAWELKRAGLDWRQGVLCRCLQGPALAVARLKANRAFASEAERVRAFVESGVGGRATYYRYARQLQAQAEPPRIPLTCTRPHEATQTECGVGVPRRRPNR